jgi:integrase
MTRTAAVKADEQRRLVLKLQDWPDRDQKLWLNGIQPSDGLDEIRHAETLKPLSVKAAARGYGRYLAFLAEHECIKRDEIGAERITPRRMVSFVKTLQTAGTKNATIKMRIFELRMAARIMCPEAELDWLTRPGGRSLDALFPISQKEINPPPSRDLLKSGQKLICEALAQYARDGMKHLVAQKLRDGLLIGVLAALAPRVRSLAEMRLGKQLRQIGDTWWLIFEPNDLKNRTRLEFEFPRQLTAALDVYLQVARPFLLKGKACQAVWVTHNGSGFEIAGIAKMIERRGGRNEVNITGPHLSRHALATSMAEADPENAGLVAAVLGISDFVVEKHYSRARQIDAGRRLTADFEAEREETRALAERAFGEKLSL